MGGRFLKRLLGWSPAAFFFFQKEANTARISSKDTLKKIRKGSKKWPSLLESLRPDHYL
jgi:hypothetical protein